MDYIAPLNVPATIENPRPPYHDGNAQTGQEGSYPSGRALEYPIREILAVIEAAGIVPSNNDLTQLLQAINQIIAAAIEGIDPGGGGGGTPPSFLLNPVFPHVTVNGGLISCPSSNGQVQVAAGQTFVHRGGVLYNSSDVAAGSRTFTTVASKTYHLRWRYNGGTPAFVLCDLADSGYNPGALAEAHPSFDTGYDDMLIARVVTDAANNPTVTSLLNRSRLSSIGIMTGTEGVLVGQNGSSWRFNRALNWSRSPDQVAFFLIKGFGVSNSDTDHNTFAYGLPRATKEQANGNPPSFPLDRYRFDAVVNRDANQELHMYLSCGA